MLSFHSHFKGVMLEIWTYISVWCYGVNSTSFLSSMTLAVECLKRKDGAWVAFRGKMGTETKIARYPTQQQCV